MAYRMIARGDPGFFGSIGKALGGVAKAAIGAIVPAPIRAVAGGVLSRAISGGGGQGATLPGGSMPVIRTPGVTGMLQRALPGGATGFEVGGFRRRGRRINPGNAKAARRAISRIKSVRKLLQGIERQLPKRKCGCGTAARSKRR